MNPIQMAQQIKHLLEQQTWTAGTGGLVFGATGCVAVFAGTPNEDQIPTGFPFALVGLDSGDVDQDDPTLINQRYTIMVAAEVAGERLGEFAIIGGAAADLGSSAGRGVGEVAERVRAAVGGLTGADGAKVILSSVNTGAPTNLGRGRHLALDELSLVAVCTSAPHYAAPQHLKYTNTKWTWSGSHCSERFDFYRYRLVKKLGRNPSASPSDGTIVYTGTTPSWTGAQYGGSTYTVFADYNSRGTAAVEGSSGPEVGAYRAVP